MQNECNQLSGSQYLNAYLCTPQILVCLILNDALIDLSEYNPVPLQPFGNCADISYLKEQFKLHQIRDVCTLLTRGLACNGMIRMLPYQFKNK